jgi:hypothetical protein
VLSYRFLYQEIQDLEIGRRRGLESCEISVSLVLSISEVGRSKGSRPEACGYVSPQSSQT